MEYNFGIVDYKDIWEGFYVKYGNYWSTFDVREGNPEHKYLSELMDEYKEEYGKEWANKRGYHDVEEFYEELWHFKRTCEYCGHVWGGLHCIHDGYQNPCPKCGKRPTVIYIDDVCDCEFDY